MWVYEGTLIVTRAGVHSMFTSSVIACGEISPLQEGIVFVNKSFTTINVVEGK